MWGSFVLHQSLSSSPRFSLVFLSKKLISHVAKILELWWFLLKVFYLILLWFFLHCLQSWGCVTLEDFGFSVIWGRLWSLEFLAIWERLSGFGFSAPKVGQVFGHLKQIIELQIFNHLKETIRLRVFSSSGRLVRFSIIWRRLSGFRFSVIWGKIIGFGFDRGLVGFWVFSSSRRLVKFHVFGYLKETIGLWVFGNLREASSAWGFWLLARWRGFLGFSKI